MNCPSTRATQRKTAQTERRGKRSGGDRSRDDGRTRRLERVEVAIDGPDGRVVARVWPGRSEDSGRSIVRIDGQLRQAAGVRIDEPVSAEATGEFAAEAGDFDAPEGTGGEA